MMGEKNFLAMTKCSFVTEDVIFSFWLPSRSNLDSCTDTDNTRDQSHWVEGRVSPFLNRVPSLVGSLHTHKSFVFFC